jgi:hypothetical protein
LLHIVGIKYFIVTTEQKVHEKRKKIILFDKFTKENILIISHGFEKFNNSSS